VEFCVGDKFSPAFKYKFFGHKQTNITCTVNIPVRSNTVPFFLRRIHTYHAVPMLFPCRSHAVPMPFLCRSNAVPLPFPYHAVLLSR
jgi:hypothetical protein